jgi:hypothetical protein
VSRRSEEGSEVPDRTSVRSASDLDAKKRAAEAAAAEEEEETNSAEERSAAAARAHVLVYARARAYYSREYSHAAIQVRAAEGFVGAGDRGGEAQGTTTREFAGAIPKRRRRWWQRWVL